MSQVEKVQVNAIAESYGQGISGSGVPPTTDRTDNSSPLRGHLLKFRPSTVRQQGSPGSHQGREDGYWEILGARVTDSENEAFWSGLLEDLKKRGLTGVSGSFPMTIPASRRWLKPPSSAHPGGYVRSAVPERTEISESNESD